LRDYSRLADADEGECRKAGARYPVQAINRSALLRASGFAPARAMKGLPEAIRKQILAKKTGQSRRFGASQ
jgi:hypothetical protein